MKKLMLLAIVIVSLLFVYDRPYAKCALTKFVVQGSVISAQTHEPVKNAKIAMLTGRQDPEYSDVNNITSDDGSFAVIVYMLPRETNSILFGERCHEKPALVEILLKKDGYKTVQKKFSEKAFEMKYENNERIIILPMFQLLEVKNE